MGFGAIIDRSPTRGLDLLVGGPLGAWAVRHAPPALVHRVVCADDELGALAAGIGHRVFAGDPYIPAFAPGPAALCIGFPRLLGPELVDRYHDAIWRLHSGLLPWGRGTHPVFWALWEGTPAGATLHELVADVDAGPVVEQLEVPVHGDDTGGSLHARVQDVAGELFTRWLPRLAGGEQPPATPQTSGGSHHVLAEFEFLRDEGRYEVPRAERERLARCLTFSDLQVCIEP